MIRLLFGNPPFFQVRADLAWFSGRKKHHLLPASFLDTKNSCLGYSLGWNYLATRWGPYQFINGLRASISPIFYKAIYRNYFTPSISGSGAHLVPTILILTKWDCFSHVPNWESFPRNLGLNMRQKSLKPTSIISHDGLMMSKILLSLEKASQSFGKEHLFLQKHVVFFFRWPTHAPLPKKTKVSGISRGQRPLGSIHWPDFQLTWPWPWGSKHICK